MPRRTGKSSSPHTRANHQHSRPFRRSVSDRLRTIQKAMARLRAEMREIAVTVDPLVDHVAYIEREFLDLERRVVQIETGHASRGAGGTRPRRR